MRGNNFLPMTGIEILSLGQRLVGILKVVASVLKRILRTEVMSVYNGLKSQRIGFIVHSCEHPNEILSSIQVLKCND